MTNHMQAAIEAGAKALPGVPANDEEVRLMQNTARAVITAAEPHLREMIAEEIRDANLPNDPVFYSGAEGYHLGIKAAARIAQGAPRD